MRWAVTVSLEPGGAVEHLPLVGSTPLAQPSEATAQSGLATTPSRQAGAISTGDRV